VHTEATLGCGALVLDGGNQSIPLFSQYIAPFCHDDLLGTDSFIIEVHSAAIIQDPLAVLFL
jgi:hypothetical protein